MATIAPSALVRPPTSLAAIRSRKMATSKQKMTKSTGLLQPAVSSRKRPSVARARKHSVTGCCRKSAALSSSRCPRAARAALVAGLMTALRSKGAPREGGDWGERASKPRRGLSGRECARRGNVRNK
jgi:hypothetical protein